MILAVFKLVLLNLMLFEYLPKILCLTLLGSCTRSGDKQLSLQPKWLAWMTSCLDGCGRRDIFLAKRSRPRCSCRPCNATDLRRQIDLDQSNRWRDRLTDPGREESRGREILVHDRIDITRYQAKEAKSL